MSRISRQHPLKCKRCHKVFTLDTQFYKHTDTQNTKKIFALSPAQFSFNHCLPAEQISRECRERSLCPANNPSKVSTLSEASSAAFCTSVTSNSCKISGSTRQNMRDRSTRPSRIPLPTTLKRHTTYMTILTAARRIGKHVVTLRTLLNSSSANQIEPFRWPWTQSFERQIDWSIGALQIELRKLRILRTTPHINVSPRSHPHPHPYNQPHRPASSLSARCWSPRKSLGDINWHGDMLLRLVQALTHLAKELGQDIYVRRIL